MREFSAADAVQSVAGTSAGTSTATATVPVGVTDGSSGVIAIYGGGIVSTPTDWETVVADPTGGLVRFLLRANLPPGETSWGFSSAGAGNWAWVTEEWANVASGGAEGEAAATQTTPGVATLASGDAAFTSAAVVGLVAVALTDNGTGSAWSTMSYSPADPGGLGGFVEVNSAAVGAGTAAGDCKVWLARRYSQAGDTSPWAVTVTYGGSMTGKTLRVALIVVAAEETELVEPAVVMASGG
jgi:hypothetical protein